MIAPQRTLLALVGSIALTACGTLEALTKSTETRPYAVSDSEVRVMDILQYDWYNEDNPQGSTIRDRWVRLYAKLDGECQIQELTPIWVYTTPGKKMYTDADFAAMPITKTETISERDELGYGIREYKRSDDFNASFYVAALPAKTIHVNTQRCDVLAHGSLNSIDAVIDRAFVMPDDSLGWPEWIDLLGKPFSCYDKSVCDVVRERVTDG